MDSHSGRKRSDQAWVQELRGELGIEVQERAYLDLGELIEKVVRQYLRRMEGNYHLDDLAFDVAQETLRKIHTKKLYDVYSGQSGAQFLTYIFSIASRQAISEMRKKKWDVERNLQSFPDEQQDAEAGVATLSLAYLIDAQSPDPEIQTEWNQFNQDLLACITNLPLARQQVFYWRVYDGLTPQEIVEQFHLSRATVDGRWFQACKALGACLGDKGWTPADIRRFFHSQ